MYFRNLGQSFRKKMFRLLLLLQHFFLKLCPKFRTSKIFLPRRVDRRKCCQVSLTKVGAKVNDDNVTKKLCYRRRTARQRLPKGRTLILEVSKFLRSLGEANGSSRAKKQLYSSSCFNTTPACDGQMDGRTEGQTHDDSTYDAIRDAIVTCARKPT